LLDRRVLEFALGLPAEQFMRGNSNRWLMRTALEGVLPSEVCWNADKSDPVRAGQLKAGRREMKEALHQCLAERATPPARALYVDMAHLMRDLDPAVEQEDQWGRNLMGALQFLDF